MDNLNEAQKYFDEFAKISELTHDGKSHVRACIFAGMVHNNAVSGEL